MGWQMFLLSSFFIIGIYGYRTQPCNVVNFDYRNYEKEYIINGGLSRPFQLTFNKNKNSLLFHEDTDVLQNTKTYMIDLNNNKVTEVPLENAVGSVVDDQHNFVIATNNGLYKYEPATKTLTQNGHENYSFSNIYKYNGKIYFTDNPKKDLYVIENQVTKVLFENKNIEAFALDSADNFYYGNSSGLFYGNLRVGTVDYIAKSVDVPFDELVINPGNEIVFVLSYYGIYKINRDSGTLKRISLKAMLDLVFDKNGAIIYSDEEHIVRLKITNKTC